MKNIPRWMVDAVVPVGRRTKAMAEEWIGTGFLYLHEDANNSDLKSLWLVTNRHVARDFARGEEVYYRMTNAAGDAVPFIMPNYNVWTGSVDKSIDVAVLPILMPWNFHEIERNFECAFSASSVLTRANLNTGSITEGDEVAVIGFPLGSVGKVKNYPTYKSGVVARIRDYADGATKIIHIDSHVINGNSGGPVIALGCAATDEDNSQPVPKLLGVVYAYKGQREAVKHEDQDTDLTYDQHSGLACVVPVDAIVATIALAVLRPEFQLRDED